MRAWATAAVVVGCLGLTVSCSSHAAPRGQADNGSATPAPTVSNPSPSAPPVARCVQRDVAARFAGGGLGTGNDFGSIVVWNSSATACRIAGEVTFTAYYGDGRRDANARPNRPVPPVAVVLPAKMRPYRDGANLAGYLTADLMGPERDDPAQPDALCREQDKLAPAILVLRLGTLTFRVTNSDPQSLQVKQVYGCHGQVLLEVVVRAT